MKNRAFMKKGGRYNIQSYSCTYLFVNKNGTHTSIHENTESHITISKIVRAIYNVNFRFTNSLVVCNNNNNTIYPIATSIYPNIAYKYISSISVSE